MKIESEPPELYAEAQQTAMNPTCAIARARHFRID